MKARVADHSKVRAILERMGAEFQGIDNQTDTYYHVPHGRLKVRQGNIENCIVWYQRPDIKAPRTCEYRIIEFPLDSPMPSELTLLLGSALNVIARVEKIREIIFVGNLKIHLDTISGHGQFIEIEAIGNHGMTIDDLTNQCNDLFAQFEIPQENLIDCSYLDLTTEFQERQDQT